MAVQVAVLSADLKWWPPGCRQRVRPQEAGSVCAAQMLSGSTGREAPLSFNHAARVGSVSRAASDVERPPCDTVAPHSNLWKSGEAEGRRSPQRPV